MIEDLNHAPLDSSDWTPGEMFRSNAERADAGDASAGIAVTLWTSDDGRYDVRISSSGMRRSEMIALLDIAKARIVAEFLGD